MKKIFPICLVVICLISNSLSSFGMIMSPMPLDGVPLPANDTTIYISGINVLVFLETDNIATINVSYTLKNSGSEDSVKVLFPFGYNKNTLTLLKDGTALTEFSESNETFTDGIDYHQINCIGFNISLKENEQTEITLDYQRPFHKQDAEIGRAFYYSFGYLLYPRNRWNHSLESNTFAIHINKLLQPNKYGNIPDCTVSETNGYLVLTYSFANDVFLKTKLYFGWMVDKELTTSGFEGISLLGALILIVSIYFVRSRRKFTSL